MAACEGVPGRGAAQIRASPLRNCSNVSVTRWSLRRDTRKWVTAVLLRADVQLHHLDPVEAAAASTVAHTRWTWTATAAWPRGNRHHGLPTGQPKAEALVGL